jgi:RHS repeat-associated protein
MKTHDVRTARDPSDDYIYGPSTTPVEEVSLSTSTPTYMTYTPTDSSWLITNAAGDETAFYGYDAFGNLAFGTPTSSFGYAGEYTDPSTGFSNLRARWYAPQTGEFTAPDPAFASTDTAYTYANDDPVNESDPTGLYVHGYCTGGSALQISAANPSAFACALVDDAGKTAVAWSNQLGLILNNPSSELAAFFANGEAVAQVSAQFSEIGLPLATVAEARGKWAERGAAVGIGKWLNVGGTTVQVDGSHWGLMISATTGASFPPLPGSVSWGSTEMHEQIYGPVRCDFSAKAINTAVGILNHSAPFNSNSWLYREAVQWVNRTRGTLIPPSAGGFGTPIQPIF